jgi:hypothetical protein
LNYKACLLCELGRQKEALDTYDKVIENTVDDGSILAKNTIGNAWYQKSLVYDDMRDYAKSRECMQKYNECFAR